MIDVGGEIDDISKNDFTYMYSDNNNLQTNSVLDMLPADDFEENNR